MRCLNRPAARDAGALPDRWLLSDVRNDAVLETVLRSSRFRLGFVFRHYHLPPDTRRERFGRLARICRERRHRVILADSAATALEWGAEGIYGAPLMLTPRRCGLLRVATAHDLREIGEANRIRADAVMLSPVFPTRSHPGAATLGPARFRLLAQRARMPVIALGGMDQAAADAVNWRRWAAIDGLSPPPPACRFLTASPAQAMM